MEILIEDRVEQALRHLQPKDAKKIASILDRLSVSSFDDLKSQFQIHKITIPGEQVFVLRATPKLRILLKYRENQTLLIEDIVSHAALRKFLGGRYE